VVSQCKLVSAGTGGELDYGNGARHHLVGHCCSGRTLVTCNAGASTYASVCRFSLSLTECDLFAQEIRHISTELGNVNYTLRGQLDRLMAETSARQVCPSSS